MDNTPQAHQAVAAVLKALSDPTRLTIIHCLADRPHCVHELVAHLGLAQSTVSAHLSSLKQAGLVHGVHHGRATEYQLSSPAVDVVLRAAETLTHVTHPPHNTAATAVSAGA